MIASQIYTVNAGRCTPKRVLGRNLICEVKIISDIIIFCNLIVFYVLFRHPVQKYVWFINDEFDKSFNYRTSGTTITDVITLQLI